MTSTPKKREKKTKARGRVRANPKLEQRHVYPFMGDVLGADLHEKRVLALSQGFSNGRDNTAE